MKLLSMVGGNVLFWAIVIMIAQAIMDKHDASNEVHNIVTGILIALAVISMIAAFLIDVYLANTGQW